MTKAVVKKVWQYCKNSEILASIITMNQSTSIATVNWSNSHCYNDHSYGKHFFNNNKTTTTKNPNKQKLLDTSILSSVEQTIFACLAFLKPNLVTLLTDLFSGHFCQHFFKAKWNVGESLKAHRSLFKMQRKMRTRRSSSSSSRRRRRRRKRRRQHASFSH